METIITLLILIVNILFWCWVVSNVNRAVKALEEIEKQVSLANYQRDRTQRESQSKSAE